MELFKFYLHSLKISKQKDKIKSFLIALFLISCIDEANLINRLCLSENNRCRKLFTKKRFLRKFFVNFNKNDRIKIFVGDCTHYRINPRRRININSCLIARISTLVHLRVHDYHRTFFQTILPLPFFQ